MQKQLISSRDGSHTFYVPELDEHYHSTHGAISESAHVFIKNGLENIKKPAVNILEVGFGTGLNAYLSLLQSLVNGRTLHYTTLEAFPIPVDEASQLNYPDQLEGGDRQLFIALHSAPWDQPVSMSPQFILHKIRADLVSYRLDGSFDLVYFDAFAPEKQPELWETKVLEKIYRVMARQGIWVSYCAKGIIKRRLKSIGFDVFSLPGPPGKREMTMAVKA